MAKRSNLPGSKRDDYRTIDPRAANILWPYLANIHSFAEPCDGDGDLVEHLVQIGLLCHYQGDIATGRDALKLTRRDLRFCDAIITNPPWSRPALHALIEHFISISPTTWLLFDADWMHNRHARPYLAHCQKIVSVGRMIWMPGTNMSGKDNAAWYQFISKPVPHTTFYGRI